MLSRNAVRAFVWHGDGLPWSVSRGAEAINLGLTSRNALWPGQNTVLAHLLVWSATGDRLGEEVSARALVPSLVCTVKTYGVEQLIESNPKVGIARVRLLSERPREAEARLAELAHRFPACPVLPVR